MHYRSPKSIQAYQVVLADSHEIPRAPHYSGTPLAHTHTHSYTTITHFGHPSQDVHHTHTHTPPPPAEDEKKEPHNPAHATPAESHTHTV